MGIIDTLSAGFDRVTKRLWLVVVPVLLDVGIWIGPKLSISELSKQIVAALPSVFELGSQYQQSIEAVRDWLIHLGAQVNVLSMLSMHIMGWPSLTSTFTPQARLFGLTQHLIEIHTWPTLFGLAFSLVLLSLLIGCFCLSLVAQQVRDEPTDIAYTLEITWRSWLRLVMLMLLIVPAGAMLISGVSIMSGLLALLSSKLAWLTLNLFALGLLWLSVYVGIILFFTVRAIVLDDMGILHSLWSSVNVVYRNFLPAIGFILLVNVIQTGLLYIWRVLAVSAVGTLVGIVGNAYVGTGLVMASFIFYRDRFVAWQRTITSQNG